MNVFKIIMIAFLGIMFFSFSNKNINNIGGYWEELSSPDQPSKNVLFFENSNDGITGKVYMLQKDGLVNQLKIENVTVQNGNVCFIIPEFGISYNGNFSKDKKHIEAKITFPDSFVMNVTANKISKNDFLAIKDQYAVKQDTSGYVYKKPFGVNDGWRVSTLENENIKSTEIINVVNNIRKGKHGAINSMLIVKNGKLVLDEYFYGYGRDDVHFLSSATKSVSSMITGVAITKGFIKNANLSVFDYLPDCDKYKTAENSAITLDNLLSMQLGFKEPEKHFPMDEDIFEYTLNRKILNKPGEVFMYDNIAPNLLAGIIKNSTGLHIDRFAEKYLFAPLKINSYDWEEGRQNGYPICQGTLCLKPRDIAKLGYLILNGGKWENKQVISKEWINKAKSKNVIVNAEDGVYYGYLFWIADFVSDGENYEVIYAGGSGGQYVFMIPKLNSVVLFTGNNFNNHKEFELFDILEKQLLGSLKGK